MQRELVDFQLYRRGGGPVGERISTSLDTGDRTDVAAFFNEVIHRDWDAESPRPEDYKMRVWRHGSEELLLTFPAPDRPAPERVRVRDVPRRLWEIWTWKG
ncbi:hypothetical protein AB0C69_28540 [Actinomadura sp. NPDC048032]|uniref:hypothetical protein n=1 Tax=Actinomadura sp. NPDC048032 TaxID=3155747 RepID=UPI0033D1BE4D